MKSEPNAVFVGICPRHSVSAMRRQPEAIPGRQVHELVLTFDAKLSAPLDEEDPLILGLVIPGPFRGFLPLGEDPFKADSRPRKEGFENLFVKHFGEKFCEGDRLDDGHGSWLRDKQHPW
jgi:hypothetical protein